MIFRINSRLSVKKTTLLNNKHLEGATVFKILLFHRKSLERLQISGQTIKVKLMLGKKSCRLWAWLT